MEVDYKKKETSRAVSARERSFQSIRVRSQPAVVFPVLRANGRVGFFAFL